MVLYGQLFAQVGAVGCEQVPEILNFCFSPLPVGQVSKSQHPVLPGH
jgi:hypothetical protein